ncbi:hypothetical protein ACIP8U_41985 [Streptomyces pseudovenezuelae]|uniref:hypothetical protein n=1 Tax=Streptomyces pseudovenezuelae TaxID=67350 RepID=UPI0036E291CE
MNATMSGWDTVWQRRLSHILDDRFAGLLSQHLRLRIRSFEAVAERVMGLRTVEIGDDFGLLSLEVDEMSTPLVRLTTPTQWRNTHTLERIVGALEAAADSAEMARNGDMGPTGTPLWIPNRGHMPATLGRLLARKWPRAALAQSFALPTMLGDDGENRLACLGIIVFSVPSSVRAAIEAGGELLQEESEQGPFAWVADPARHPVLLWEKPLGTYRNTFMPARVDFTTNRIDHMAKFYRSVAGWRTQVLPQDGSINALLTHHDRGVGLLREDRAEKQTLAPLLEDLRKTVWSAEEEPELTVDSLPLRPRLGRKWRVTDSDGSKLFLAEHAAQAPALIRWSPWSHLPGPLATAFDDLDHSFEVAADMVLQLREDHPPAPPREQVDALTRMLADVIIPAAVACGASLRMNPLPGPNLEVITSLRTTVLTVLQSLGVFVQEQTDADLTELFRRACSILMQAQLLPEAIDELQGGNVSV